MYRIMIVEDDDKIAGILGQYIKKYQYDMVRVNDYDAIKTKFLQEKPDLVLLDINLPQYDGFYWCRQIRTISNVPIIFISARVGEMDQVMAIENGGDDYITKPFSLEVVLAKIKSALRRAYGAYAGQTSSTDMFNVSGLALDAAKNTLEWEGREIFLSHKEFRLLRRLAEKTEQIVSREELLEVLWDDVSFVDDNTLTVNVTRVRKRLADLGITGAIETIRGQGYLLHVTWGAES